MQVHLNYSSMCTPDAHALGCAHQARKAVKRRGYAGTTIEEVASLRELAVNYWSDFIDEWTVDGEVGEEIALGYLLGGEPKVYPCITDHLPER